MKREALLLIILIIFITGCQKKYEIIHLMQVEDYAKISKKNIEKLEIIKETVEESSSQTPDKKEIQSIYKDLQKMIIGPRTNMSCEDNVTTYVFTLKDDKKVELKIECDTVVIGENRYYLSSK